MRRVPQLLAFAAILRVAGATRAATVHHKLRSQRANVSSRGVADRPGREAVAYRLSSNLMPQALVHVDPEPLVLDMSFAGALNPRNGTPWFRYKNVGDKGVAGHPHFSGLSSTGDFKEDILQGHNVVRSRAGLSPLEWSSGLQKLASDRVYKLANEGCYIKHSSTSYRWYAAGFNYVGENLYKVINMAPTGVDIADAWYAEIDDYTFGDVGKPCVKEKCLGRTSPPCTIGHFTQMMWEKSSSLGCGLAECPNQAKRTFIAVCHYGPGGNIAGQEPFSGSISGTLGFAQERCPVKGGAQRLASIFALLISALSLSVPCFVV